MRIGKLAAVLAVVLAAGALSAGAADVTWTGGGDAVNWSDPLNWDAGKPGVGDNVIFTAAVNTTIDENFDVASISFGGTQTVNRANNALLSTGTIQQLSGGSTFKIPTTLSGTDLEESVGSGR